MNKVKIAVRGDVLQAMISSLHIHNINTVEFLHGSELKNIKAQLEEARNTIKEQEMKTVMIESPYSGDIAKNTEYARLCMHDSYFNHNEAPFVAHLLWTTLDSKSVENKDFIPDEEEPRETALVKCRLMRQKIGIVVFYYDKGWSSGMIRAEKEAFEDKLCIIYRSLNGENPKD